MWPYLLVSALATGSSSSESVLSICTEARGTSAEGRYVFVLFITNTFN